MDHLYGLLAWIGAVAAALLIAWLGQRRRAEEEPPVFDDVDERYREWNQALWGGQP